MTPVGQLVRSVLDKVAKRQPLGMTADQMAVRLQDGRLSAFLAGPRSAIILGITRTGRAHIYAAAGDMRDLLRTLPRVELWARAHGMKTMTIAGREGWIRVLAPFGYRRVADAGLIEKVL